MICPHCREIMNHCLSADEPPLSGYYCDDCKEFFYASDFDEDGWHMSHDDDWLPEGEFE